MVLLQRPLSWNSSMVLLTYPSFRLLLYLEWLLLATALFMEVLLPFEFSWSLLVRVVAIATFSLMGLRLPMVKLETKLFYTALEFVLILLPTTQHSLSSRSVFLLCLVLVMRSCLIFKRSGQLLVLGLSLLSYGTLVLSRPIVADKFMREKLIAMSLDWRLSNILLFSLTLVFALLLINALLAERQSREQLEIAHLQLEITNQQLCQYALRIEDQATLQERNRIAREIHDGLGHTLVAQTIQINNTLLFWESNNDKALTFLKQAKELGAEALLEIRRSLSLLRSNPLQGQSLQSAIEKLLTDFHQTTGIEPSCKIDVPHTLPTEINTALYRIVQESLTNICKHAQATSVTVRLLARTGMIHLSIEDNGKGFNPTQNTTGFGLQGMRERAVALGAQLNLQSQLGTGCCISVSLPLSKLLVF
ncbi:integral membrane sensor signal transduction histidine kinase [Nostoc punctiforme PCC 73102]|uniref:histidine kinase n=2 Tax=Nostoc punctiforme TaxID=272131 RepID=B2J2K6_NOSP7|nr:integral membrane sensor signal transduction histidine kinase [Nostoc punctiforme PCC 73102]